MGHDHWDENEIQRRMDEARNQTDEFEEELERHRHRDRQRELEIELELSRRREEFDKSERKNILVKKFIATFTILAGMIGVLGISYRILQGSRLGELILSGWTAPAIVTSLVIMILSRIWTDTWGQDDNSFVELDKRARNEKTRYRTSKFDTLIATINDSVKDVESPGKSKERSRTIAGGLSFVEQMRAVIESLDYQIDYAEQKASNLLDIGRRFVRWGIWLYVLSIVVWQIYLWSVSFVINPGIIAGMVSCSLLFIIVEFLGAWYLKQYRHYGDSAFSYMKVRSSYNRYMLAYCAVVQFSGDDLPAAKDDILKVLAEPEKWPDFKEVTSNDFNHMLQSVESLGVVFEKLKGVFGRNGKGNSE